MISNIHINNTNIFYMWNIKYNMLNNILNSETWSYHVMQKFHC